MSRTLNEVRLIGRLGQDPEMKYTPGGKAVTTLRLATNHHVKAADGSRQEETDWHTVVLWDKLAEISNQYLQKGAQVFIGGRLQTRSWEKDGQRQYRTEIVADELLLLDRAKAPSVQSAADYADEAPAF